MKKRIWVLSACVALGLVPVLAFAQESNKSACKTIIRIVQAYPQFNLTVPIQCKQWENDAVKKQCTELKVNLRIGDRGERVRILHQMLVQAGYGPFANDEFDETTAAAVVGFQEQYRSEILVPNGLARGTGFVGVSTRAKLNALFGCVTVPPDTSAISLRVISAPNSLKIDEEGTWKLEARTPGNADFSISVDWGDTLIVPLTAASAEESAINTASFTHRYTAVGNYLITFRLTSANQTRTITRRVQVRTDGATADEVTVISPNGGETWRVGETRTISWRATKEGQVTLWMQKGSSCPVSRSDGIVCTMPVPAPLQIARLNSHEGVNSYNWRIRTQYGTSERETIGQYNLTSGEYWMRICSTGNAHCDLSDDTFTLTVLPSANRGPVIQRVSGPSSLAIDATGTWSILAYDPDGDNLSYTIRWGDETSADTAVSAASSISLIANQQTTFTHRYAATGTYTVIITANDPSGASAQTSLSVMVRNAR